MKKSLLSLCFIGMTLSSVAATLPTTAPLKKDDRIPSYAIPSRFTFTFDRKAHLEWGQVTTLIPLKSTQQLLQFTQIGLQHQDQQWTGNLGIGARYFKNNVMLGGNAFFNKNYTSDQQNISIGVEIATNFVKLTANDYLRLSNSWKNSNQLIGYRQQPANGYDVSLQAWLPVFPQIGAEFRYQKYYGGLIALMGSSDDSNALYSDANNTRIAINYTPIPLITFGAAFQASEDKQHDTQFTLQLHYVFGEKLANQLNPNAVAELHTLNGMRYSLVERNNSIAPRLQLI